LFLLLLLVYAFAEFAFADCESNCNWGE